MNKICASLLNKCKICEIYSHDKIYYYLVGSILLAVFCECAGFGKSRIQNRVARVVSKRKREVIKKKYKLCGFVCVMGCFGSQSSKTSQDDSKNQKRRSDAITRQLQKDKQVYRATHRLLLLGEQYS